jgi:hypothetical protein
MRSVTAATWLNVVYPSSISSSGGPSTGIWKKWSITQKLDIPACSASTPRRRRVGPSDWGEPGQVKLGTCSPMRTAPSHSRDVLLSREDARAFS